MTINVKVLNLKISEQNPMHIKKIHQDQVRFSPEMQYWFFNRSKGEKSYDYIHR